FAFQLRLPAGGASESRPATLARLEADPGPGFAVERKPHPSDLRAARAVSVPWNVPVRIEFENLDDRVAARLDGREILALEYTSLPEGAFERPAESRPRPPSGSHELYLIVANALAELSSIRVYRDVYYIALVDSEPWGGIQLGEHEYFAMGDNSPSSSDGRYWGSVPEENLIGKAFFVFWPAWPTNFQMKIIR
ncbi:MAG: S26 family signal peptidase, partial [Planctomycetota bacterium]